MKRDARAPSLLRKVAGVLGGAILLLMGIMFSVVLLAVIVGIGLTAWGYLWWKSRGLRKTLRQRAPSGQVIDGEAVVVDESRAGQRPVLPDDSTHPK